MAAIYTVPRAINEAHDSREALNPARGMLHGLLGGTALWLAILWGVSKLWQ